MLSLVAIRHGPSDGHGLQVLATRKGVRNQIKNLLWRSKSSAPDLPRAAAAAGPAFGAQSVEGQLRQLADLAFLMQDYETCLSTLRLLASDLKSDKDWRHYAAAQARFLRHPPSRWGADPLNPITAEITPVAA